MENDPEWANDRDVSVNGFPDHIFKEGFIEEVLGQGTGFLNDGTFITIDWINTQTHSNEWWFTIGIGNQNIVPWETVASVDQRLEYGDEIIIEVYQNKGTFRVVDEGGGLNSSQVDVYVGIATFAEVNSGTTFDTVFSRVGLVQ